MSRGGGGGGGAETLRPKTLCYCWGGRKKRRGETLESSNSPEHSSTSPQKPELDFSSDDSAAILCCDWFIFRDSNAATWQEVVLNFERFSHMCFSSSPIPKYHAFQSENVQNLMSDFAFLCLFLSMPFFCLFVFLFHQRIFFFRGKCLVAAC